MQRIASGVEVIAHRGASAAAPENTDEAFELAVTLGADVLELDIRSTFDGELVVVHDATLARTTGDPRRVDSLTRSDLETLPPSLRPLTLDSVLERHGESARLLIELKEPQPSSEGLVVDAIERHGMADRVALQVSNLPALLRLRLRAPSLELASLHRRKPSLRTLERVARCAATISIWHLRLDAGLVAAAHARGLAVGAWTVNSPAAIDHMLAIGVDGIITDVPDITLARTLLKREPATATNLSVLAPAV